MNLVPFMEQWDMFPPPGGTVLVAVSGGRDSMCLLHYLHELGKKRNFTVAGGHLNHAMRPEADSDETFVRRFCEQMGISFYSRTTPVYEMAKKWNLTVEEAGRRARYEFLRQTADAIGAEKIATAHHLADQAETVLLHLLRGTGPQGLGGIPPVRGRYIRPLLHTPREVMEAYNELHGIGHVEDSTNEDVDYARNRLRLCVWPELEKVHPSARENIARCAAIARQESDYLNLLAAQRLPAEGTELSCEALHREPKPMQRRMIRLLLDRLPAGKKDVGADHIEAVLSLSETGGIVHLPSGMMAVCRRGVLHLEMETTPLPPMPLTMGENRWGHWAITVSREPMGDVILGAEDPCELSVRTWRSEDRLQLPEGRGSRSLKRLFTDRGITPEKRNTIPVICVNDCAAYVQGVGMDGLFLPEKTGRKIYIRIRYDG